MSAAHDHSIMLILSSDVHGRWTADDDSAAGMAGIASYVAERKREQQAVCWIDAGDLLQGTPLADYLARNGRTGAERTAELLACCGLDLAVPGNHDFDYGFPYLQQVMQASTFPWMAANVLDGSGGPIAREVVEMRFGQRVVAFIGVTTRLPKWQHPERMHGLEMKDEVETVRSLVTALRRRSCPPDAIVVVYHGGLADPGHHSLTTDRTSAALENQALRMIDEVDGIDVLLTGHQHDVVNRKIGGTLVLQPGAFGRFAAEVTLTFHAARPELSSRIIEVQGRRHAALEEAIRPIRMEADQDLKRPLCRLEQDIHIQDYRDIVRTEHPYVAWMHQVQMDRTGAELSAVAYADSSFHRFERPAVRLEDIRRLFPFEDKLRVLRIDGQTLKAALEVSASWYDGQSLHPGSIWSKPHLMLYQWVMVRGVRYVIDLERQPGARITSLTYEGRPVQDGQLFRIVMSEFLAAQASQYPMFRELPGVCKTTEPLGELLVQDAMKRDVWNVDFVSSWELIGG